MSSNKNSRYLRGVYFTKAQRKRLRNLLLKKQGNKCFWCGNPMEIPKIGFPSKNLDNMATIEHHVAVNNKDPENIKFMSLVHKKCNR